MKRRCFCCGKDYEYKAGVTGLELTSTSAEYKYPCIECCQEIGLQKGFKGLMKAGVMTSEKFLKKYIAVHPELDFMLDDFYDNYSTVKDELKEQFHDIKAGRDEAKAKKEKEKRFASGDLEVQHTCLRCGHVWYTNFFDDVKNVEATLTHITTLNKKDRLLAMANEKEPDRCPKCGSRKTEREYAED